LLIPTSYCYNSVTAYFFLPTCCYSCYTTDKLVYTLITTPARPRKEPTKVVRLPQSVCDCIVPLLTDIGTDAVLALLSHNPQQSQQSQQSSVPDIANSDPTNFLQTLSIVLSRLDALEQSVFQDKSSDTVKDITPASPVTSPPDPKPSKKDLEQIAAAPVVTEDEDIPEDIPLSGTATPDELPSFPETTRSLAARWHISPSVLTRQRQRYHDRPRGFFEYSLTKEDGAFGWFYDSTELLFYPILYFPDS